MFKKSLLSAALLFSLSAHAEPVHELLEVMGGKNQVVQIHHQFVSMMAQGNPELAQYEPVIKQWAETYLSWDEMKQGMAAVYTRHFSDDELQQMVEFYKTPVGQKNIDLMPVLFQEGGQVGAQLAQKYQPQLLEMLEKAGLEIH